MAMAVFPTPANRIDGKRIAYEANLAHLPFKAANVAVGTSLEFELQGVNVANADQAFNAKGGIDLTSHGGANDSAILAPHTTAQQSIWAKSGLWAPTNQPWVGFHLATPAVTNCTFWAGLKLTSTDVKITDDDQVYVRYQNGTDTTWQLIYSIAGTDVQIDTGVAVTAGTEYQVWFTMTSGRRPCVWIASGSGLLRCVASPDQTGALTAAAALFPFCGVLSATTATAKVLTVRRLEGSIATGI